MQTPDFVVLTTQATCRIVIDSRVHDGFLGNPDFTGLGIRLGIYLQWLAIILSNVSL